MAYDFQPSDEQRMLVDTVRQFIEKELYPHEREVDRLGHVMPDLAKQLKAKAKEVGSIRRICRNP